MVVTTVISTAVSTIVAAAFKWGGDLLTRLRARLAPDHRPLTAGDWALTSSFTASVRFRVFAACAPNHSLKQTEIDPDKAIQFVRSAFPEYADAAPRRSLPQAGVKFEAPSENSDQPYVWVWKCGRVDYSTFIDASPCSDEGRALSVSAILRPILTLADAMASSEYSAAFPRHRLRRRRYDWFIAVSTEVHSADHQSMPWTELIFPGRRPKRASEKSPFCPVDGYARQALVNWKPRPSKDYLVAAFLDSFLKQNGYHDCVPAIEDVCAAVRSGTFES